MSFSKNTPICRENYLSLSETVFLAVQKRPSFPGSTFIAFTGQVLREIKEIHMDVRLEAEEMCGCISRCHSEAVVNTENCQNTRKLSNRGI